MRLIIIVVPTNVSIVTRGECNSRNTIQRATSRTLDRRIDLTLRTAVPIWWSVYDKYIKCKKLSGSCRLSKIASRRTRRLAGNFHFDERSTRDEAVYGRWPPFSCGNSINTAIDNWFECLLSGDGQPSWTMMAIIKRHLPRERCRQHRILSLPRVRTQCDYSVTSLSVLYRTWRGDGKTISFSADDFINHVHFPPLSPLLFSTGEIFLPPIPLDFFHLSARRLAFPTDYVFSSFLLFSNRVKKKPPIWNNDDCRVHESLLRLFVNIHHYPDEPSRTGTRKTSQGRICLGVFVNSFATRGIVTSQKYIQRVPF